MIAYTRTDDYSAEELQKVTDGIAMMIFGSKRSETISFNYSMAEVIKYGLSYWDRFQTLFILKTTKVIVIRERDLPTVQGITKRLLPNLKFEWTILDSVDRDLNEYAYKTRSKKIRFKLNLMRKERVFGTDKKRTV